MTASSAKPCLVGINDVALEAGSLDEAVAFYAYGPSSLSPG